MLHIEETTATFSLQNPINWFTRLSKLNSSATNTEPRAIPIPQSVNIPSSFKHQHLASLTIAYLKYYFYINYCIFKILFLYLHKRKINIIINRP